MKVQHNLKLEVWEFCLVGSEFCPFFIGWSFSGSLFLISLFYFFLWQPTLAPVPLALYYLAFLKLFFFGWTRIFLMLSCIAYFPMSAFRCLIILTFWDVIAFFIWLFEKLSLFSWCFMILSISLRFDRLLRGFDFLGLWFCGLGLVDAILFLLEVYGVVVRSFLLFVL